MDEALPRLIRRTTDQGGNMRTPRIRNVAVTGGAALALLVMAPGAAHADTSGYNKISPVPGRLCAQASGDGSNGSRVVLGDCGGWGASATSWNFVLRSGLDSRGSGWYIITNGITGRCLDAENDAGGSPNNLGDKVQVWDCYDNDMQQQWYPWPEGDGTYELVSRFNTNMVLDARSDSGWGTTVAGTPLQLWTANYQAQQKWYLAAQ